MNCQGDAKVSAILAVRRWRGGGAQRLAGSRVVVVLPGGAHRPSPPLPCHPLPCSASSRPPSACSPPQLHPLTLPFSSPTLCLLTPAVVRVDRRERRAARGGVHERGGGHEPRSERGGAEAGGGPGDTAGGCPWRFAGCGACLSACGLGRAAKRARAAQSCLEPAHPRPLSVARWSQQATRTSLPASCPPPPPPGPSPWRPPTTWTDAGPRATGGWRVARGDVACCSCKPGDRSWSCFCMPAFPPRCLPPRSLISLTKHVGLLLQGTLRGRARPWGGRHLCSQHQRHGHLAQDRCGLQRGFQCSHPHIALRSPGSPSPASPCLPPRTAPTHPPPAPVAGRDVHGDAARGGGGGPVPRAAPGEGMDVECDQGIERRVHVSPTLGAPSCSSSCPSCSAHPRPHRPPIHHAPTHRRAPPPPRCGRRSTRRPRPA